MVITAECLSMFQRPACPESERVRQRVARNPLFKSTPPRQRSCSVPRIWSCSCRCHKFDVLCWEINKCICWIACEQDARESSRKGFNLEDADRHSGKNCECQRRAKKWAKKNRHKKSESEKARNLKILMEKPGFCMYSTQHTHNKAREFKDEQKILDNHVWELMNPEKPITETK